MGDKYDNLIVVDGNGNQYKLDHRFLDSYFINEVYPSGKNDEANKKLLEKYGK